MIKELTELVLLVEQSIPRPTELISSLSNGNPDVIQLYGMLHQNSFRTEAEAIEMAGVGERTKFRKVARELMRILEIMVLQIGSNAKSGTCQLQDRLRGYELMALVKTLVTLSCKNSAKRYAEELLHIGQTYARPEFVVEASKALMDYVAIAGDDPKSFDKYYELYETHSGYRVLEEKAQIYLERIRLPYVRKKAFQKENGEVASRYLQELEPHVGHITSHHFHLSYYSLKSYRFVTEARYHEASLVHLEAIRYFERCGYTCNNTLTIFYYLEIVNCFYLNNYKRGARYYEKAINLSSVGNINWFGTLELGFYLRMYEADYEGAAAIYATATKHKKFFVLRDIQQESWTILGAYLYIVQQLSGDETLQLQVPKVRSSRFRNDIKDFSQDKMGMNIAVLAAEVLLEFVEGKDDSLWDRIAALEKYRERYLRNSDDTHRSQLFIKILVILSRYNYDGDKFLDKARPYLEELQKAPLQMSNQAHELEIVPYERLVRLLSEALRRRNGRAVGFQYAEKMDRVIGVGGAIRNN